MAVHNEFLNEGRRIALASLCQWLEIPRATAYYQLRERKARPVDHALELVVYEVIQEFPTFGSRRVWAWLRFCLGWPVNRKTVARPTKRRGWTVKQRKVGGRPRTRLRPPTPPGPNPLLAPWLLLCPDFAQGLCRLRRSGDGSPAARRGPDYPRESALHHMLHLTTAEHARKLPTG